MKTPRFLTAPDAAAKLGVTPQRVRQLCASGQLKATRFGELMWHIEESDFKKFVKLDRPTGIYIENRE